MSTETKPIFLIGSGRSGTRSFFRMLTGCQELEIHHEYAVSAMQKAACLYFMGKISAQQMDQVIIENHGAAIFHSKRPIWADSSNKLVWVIDRLATLFPDAKFLAVMRDGRKVCSSFYYKLREEMYDDDSVAELSAWLRNSAGIAPPAEKRYWWNIPQPGQPFHEVFGTFDRLQRVCYHWNEANRTILDCFSKLNADRTKIVRLEDLKEDAALLKSCIEFMGLSYDRCYFEYLQTPRNVFLPLDFQLTRGQLAKFYEICDPIMEKLGYTDERTYRVEY